MSEEQKTAHTPGPWKLEVNEKSATVRVLGRRGDGNTRSSDGLGDLVCVDCAAEPDAAMFSTMLPEQVANARLIAASPDLFEALRWFIEDIDGQHTSMVGFDQNVAKARAALAKAEGRS